MLKPFERWAEATKARLQTLLAGRLEEITIETPLKRGTATLSILSLETTTHIASATAWDYEPVQFLFEVIEIASGEADTRSAEGWENLVGEGEQWMAKLSG